MLKRIKTLLEDIDIVFAPIGKSQRFYVLVLASIVTVLELTGFVLVAIAITSIDGNVPAIATRMIGEEFSAVALTVAAFALFVGRGLVTGLYHWWVLGVINEGERQAIVQYVSTYLALPYEQQLQTGSSDVLRTVRISIGRSYQMFAIGAVDLLAEIPAILALIAVVFVIAPGAAVSVVFLLALSALIFQRFAGNRLVELGHEHERINVLDFQLLLQIVSGTRELIVRQVEGAFLGTLADNRELLVDVQRRMSFLKASARIYLEILLVVGLGIVLLVVGLARDGSIALGIVGVFAAAGFRALPSAARLLLGFANVQSGRAPLEQAARRMRDIEIALPISSGQQSPERPLGRLADAGQLSLEDVWFQYPSQPEPVLRGIDLEVRAGSSMALVGRSGAGKTTLVDVMLGLLTPTNGAVYVDGQLLAHDEVKKWRSRTALVPQDVFLLDASIADNVRFGFQEDEMSPTVEDCLRKAQLWSDVNELPKAIETIIGPKGTQLSGGQRQRLGIARALYMNPTVIFLDEATSALDVVTERALADALEALKGEVTMITVAHRLSTVRRSSQTAFIEDGRVVDVGSYEELQQRCTPFQEMIEAAELSGGIIQGKQTSD